jgi:hypothetical protein
MDLIDRDELTKKINAEYWYCRHYELGKMVDMITEAPTVDAQPVRHGQWEPDSFRPPMRTIAVMQRGKMNDTDRMDCQS